MSYTTEDMIRDLIPPAMIVIALVVVWSAISAFEAEAVGRRFFECLFSCAQ